MKMEFGLGTGRNERIHEIADIARVAEEQGFDHITLVDQPFMSRDVHVGATLRPRTPVTSGSGMGWPTP